MMVIKMMANSGQYILTRINDNVQWEFAVVAVVTGQSDFLVENSKL